MPTGPPPGPSEEHRCSSANDILVPDIGDFKDVPIIEIYVKPGDTVKAEDPLLSLESDKATMDVPAPRGGTVGSLAVKVGDRVSEGSLLMRFEAQVAAAAAAAAVIAEAAKPSISAPPSPVNAPTGVAEVRVPDIGDFKDVPVIEIFVKVGDTVKAEDPLISLESDKATMDVPAPLSGVVRAIQVEVGDKVSEGSAILSLATGDPAAAVPAVLPLSSVPSAPATPGGASAAAASAGGAIDEAAFALAYAGPAVRKLARELGVDLGRVKGSGDHGRIVREDVESFAKGGAAPAAPAAKTAPGASNGVGGIELLAWPKVDFAKFGPVERKEMSRIKKISAANLHRNWVVIPHVTTHDEADITELEAFRVQMNKELEKSGVKISMLPFMMKAAVSALKKFPEFNASLDGDALVIKKYWHIGFAADTPNGLVVPVIRDVDSKTVPDIAKEMAERQAGAGRQAEARPDAGRHLHDQLARRHRRHLLHADHQCARGLDHGRLQELLEERLDRRQDLQLAPHAAAVAVVGPPCDRRRRRGALQPAFRQRARRPAARAVLRTAAMASRVEVKVPDIGDFRDVEIIEMLVKPGEVVAVDTGLIMVESDKASMEIPSSHAGTVKELKVKLGDKVSEGTVILVLESADATAAAPAANKSRRPRPPRHPRPPGPPRLRAATPARPIPNARCWCSVPGPAAIRRPFAVPTSA